jgi:hypothetical protein
VNARLRPLLATLALALLVFIVVPASLYLGNRGEFLTAPLPLLQLLLLPAGLLVVVALVALRLSRRQEFSRYTSLVATLTLLVWAQTYLLVWDYGVLDGSPIDWDTRPWRGWLDASLWLAALGAAVAWHRRLAAPLATAACVIVALQAGVCAAEAFKHRDALALKASKRLEANRLEAMAQFSRQRNVLHIILDSFQADVFKDLVTGDGGDAIQAALPGFTYFEEQLGTFPATYLALPVIVSGQVYRNHVPRAEFIESAYAGKSVLNAASAAGYEVDLAADSWMLDLLMKGRFDNAYLTAQVPLVQEAARLLDLALFRMAPHHAKRWVYRDQQWLAQRLVTRSPLAQFPYYSHNAFLSHVTRNFAADREAPVYKFFHLMTTHAPLVVNPDCSPAGQALPRVRETVTAQSRCSLAFVVALLNRMKEAGVYDDALIVLMGDHGGHVPPHRYAPGSIVSGNYEYALPADLVALATPLLAIKPPGDTAAFRISPRLTSMTDVAATVDALLGLDSGLPGTSIWDPAYGASGERHFYAYRWSKLDPVSEYIELIQQHPVTGSAYDLKSWHIGPLYPPPHP